MRIKDLGKPIGRKPNVYAWGASEVIDLYGAAVPRDFITALGQAEIAMYEAGLPVPAVRSLVEIEGRLGQIYERIEGRTFADELLCVRSPDDECIDRLAPLFAEIQAKVHNTCHMADDLPAYKENFPTLIERIPQLTPQLKKAVLLRLAELPDGDRICHGDYHPYIVIQSPSGPIVVGWNHAHLGNPMEDVARTTLMCEGFRRMMPEIDGAVTRFTNIYLERYFEITGTTLDQIEAWWPVVCAARLADPVPELHEWLLEEIRKSL